MNLTNALLYGPPILALILLLFKWRGMKKFIPAALFAGLMANLICHVAMMLNLWQYPVQFEEAIVNCIIIPVMTMFWLRYAPGKWSGLLYWSLIWSIPLTALEYFGERYSNILKYNPGYYWYYSFAMWVVSWFVWYYFHQWFNKESRNISSAFE